MFARFLKDESSATAIEYGLIAAGISVAIVTVVGGVGQDFVLPRSYVISNTSL